MHADMMGVMADIYGRILAYSCHFRAGRLLCASATFELTPLAFFSRHTGRYDDFGLLRRSFPMPPTPAIIMIFLPATPTSSAGKIPSRGEWRLYRLLADACLPRCSGRPQLLCYSARKMICAVKYLMPKRGEKSRTAISTTAQARARRQRHYRPIASIALA